MNSAIERLLGLRVVDVMNAPVAVVQENASMAEAAKILAENSVTGAPVVDVQGRCVGMLSTTDFALREARHGSTSAPSLLNWQQQVVLGSDESPLHVESFHENRVGEHMSLAVQTINETATLINAGRVMCREHIHRLVIVDEESRPVGVVSSLDLVAAMIAAIEE